MIDIDKLIEKSMKEHDVLNTTVFRNIKAKIQEYKTAKTQKPYTEEVEVKMLSKMYDELLADSETFKKANRVDLYNECINQSKIIKQFLPKAVPDTEIASKVNELIPNPIEKKEMGKYIKLVKANLPANADGKIISEYVKRKINL